MIATLTGFDFSDYPSDMMFDLKTSDVQLCMNMDQAKSLQQYRKEDTLANCVTIAPHYTPSISVSRDKLYSIFDSMKEIETSQINPLQQTVDTQQRRIESLEQRLIALESMMWNATATTKDTEVRLRTDVEYLRHQNLICNQRIAALEEQCKELQTQKDNKCDVTITADQCTVSCGGMFTGASNKSGGWIEFGSVPSLQMSKSDYYDWRVALTTPTTEIKTECAHPTTLEIGAAGANQITSEIVAGPRQPGKSKTTTEMLAATREFDAFDVFCKAYIAQCETLLSERKSLS